MKKILNTLIISIVLLSVVIPVSVFAINIDTKSYVPLTDIPGLKDATSSQNPGGVLKILFNLSIGIGGILAVIMIIFAGFKYMYEESIFGKSDAKQKLTNAFFGLLLILGSYIILRTINSDLLKINLLLPKGDGALGGLIADKKASDNLLSLIKQANIDYQRSLKEEESLRTEVALIEKTQETLLAELDKMKREGKSLASPEALKIQDELDRLNTEYEKKSDQADTIRKSAEDKRLSEVKTVADTQINEALEKGDSETALRIAQKVASIQQTEIERREKTGQDATSLALDQKVTGEKNSVVLAMGKFLNETSTGTYPTRSENGQTNFFNTRSSLVSQINSKYNELSALDLVRANEYRLAALTELKKVDDQWSKNLGCTNGTQTITGADNKITYTCKQ